MNIAVFGGSFSPVHIGHIAVATAAVDAGLADEVWMMPCRRNPLKDTALMPDNRRLDLLEKAVEYANRRVEKGIIKVSNAEFSLPTPSYTADTLRFLQKEYPEHRFRLITGADSYNNFHDWKDWEWIERNFAPIVYPRPGYEIQEVRPSWTLLENVALHDVSSTAIRESMAKNEEMTNLMPWVSRP